MLECQYTPGYKVVQESRSVERKARLDPVQPGCSIGHVDVSAGTLGCIVYDRETDEPYVLSNWHILQGLTGTIGDSIVQPGPHDDNRIEQNRLGKLIRSHLGPAGDCAVASIEDRSFIDTLMDLDITVQELGEAELGDKVIKSSRTTGLTYGAVTRIHTVTKINFEGELGEKVIGGFEIGPDPDSPASTDEISMGGDSGAVWLFRSPDGEPTSVMAGLHFAGEGTFDVSERALACYPRSVFEKLNISLKPRVKHTYSSQTPNVPNLGYNPHFLSEPVPAPVLTSKGERQAYKLNGSYVIPYTHFSLAQNKRRRLPMWVAWNIDGNRIRRLSRKKIPFLVDPRLPVEYQMDNTVYAHNPLDRGHIARRADLCWGGLDEAQKANRDSFYFTNIAPQMNTFNQGSRGGIWGELEDAVFQSVEVQDLKVSIIAGPVFDENDRPYRDVKIPREFFKVIAFSEGNAVKARAFLLTQNLDQLESLDLAEFKVYQVSLTEIESRCEFYFPTVLKNVDGFSDVMESQLEGFNVRTPLTSVDQIIW